MLQSITWIRPRQALMLRGKSRKWRSTTSSLAWLRGLLSRYADVRETYLPSIQMMWWLKGPSQAWAVGQSAESRGVRLKIQRAAETDGRRCDLQGGWMMSALVRLRLVFISLRRAVVHSVVHSFRQSPHGFISKLDTLVTSTLALATIENGRVFRWKLTLYVLISGWFYGSEWLCSTSIHLYYDIYGINI